MQGELLQVSLTSHAVTNITKFAPDGQQGGGVWTSPTVDAATNTIFVATGTINQYTQPLSQAIVALDATTMAVKSHWQLPFEAETYDSDWGVTPDAHQRRRGASAAQPGQQERDPLHLQPQQPRRRSALAVPARPRRGMPHVR